MIKKFSYRGAINVSDAVIKNIVGITTMSCYGVVGMSSQNTIRDFYSEKMNKSNFDRGINLKTNGNVVDLEIHIVLGYSIPVKNTCEEIRKMVAYQLEKKLEIKARNIDIFVEGIDNYQ